MSAFKKIAGLVAGVSAMGAIGVAVAQGVPPNPYITNPALGAGEQTVNMTPIGETGVLAWSDNVPQQTATITKQEEVAVAPAQDNSQVASTSADTSSSQQVAQAEPAPAPAADNTQSLGAGPDTSHDTVAKKPRADRG